MTRRPPVLGLLGAVVAVFVLAVGGTATFEGLGRVPARPVAAVLLAGSAFHAASRYVPHGPAVRGLAWATWAAGASLSGSLGRPPVVGGIAVAGLLDLAFHAGDRGPAPDRGGRAVGGAAVAAGSGLLLALAVGHVAGPLGVAARLALTSLLGGGLVAAYALRPDARTPGRLLAGALAFGLGFRVLASPVLPLGPILAYWIFLGAAGLALWTGTRFEVREPLPAGLRRHEQEVRRRPDPLDRGLEAAVGAYLDGDASPERLRRAVARHDADLADRIPDLPDGPASRRGRVRALEDALEIPLEETR